MKFTIAENHREYFQENNKIEFEGILSDEEIIHLNTALGGVLSERLRISCDVVTKQPAAQLFEAGRDLWRGSAEVKKITCQRCFGEIASQLINQKPLRLGYDHFLPSIRESAFQIRSAYTGFLQNPASLAAISSLQGIVCGWLLCLSAGTLPLLPSTEECNFPIVPGNAIFYHPKAEIDFSKALLGTERSYYMVVYTGAKGVYIANKRDFHIQAWKKLGYTFGERLTDALNPIIYR